MFDLIDDWKLILDILIAAPIAWQSPAEVATALGRDVEETTDVMCDMDVAGWLSVWVIEPVPLVTLSALTAHRLQVVLIEDGPEEFPRWAPATELLPSPPKAGEEIALTEHFARQDHLLSPDPPPDEASAKFECRPARSLGTDPRMKSALRAEELPLPILLLGQNLSPWPGPGERAGQDVCPACASRPLRSHVYCLVCDRWGLDEALLKQTEDRAAPSGPGPAPSPSATPVQRVWESLSCIHA